VLTGGRKCVIFQLIDDHSRYAVASHVAAGETAKDAMAVFTKAVAAHGVPQRLLSDNGLALNPSRRGIIGQLVAHVAALGVQAITGKPHKPTTQGKNERFHQTLFRYLDKQPLADSLTILQAQVDAFDDIYNTERPHQGLPGRITPLAAWQATPKAEPPRPKPDPAGLPAARARREPSTETTSRPTRWNRHQDRRDLRHDRTGLSPVPSRPGPRLRPGPRHHRRRPTRRQDHHCRPER
jgi:putative transposase